MDAPLAHVAAARPWSQHESIEVCARRHAGDPGECSGHPRAADSPSNVQIEPTIQQMIRRSTGNSFWINATAGASTDPARITGLNAMLDTIQSTTPQQLQALAQKYLQPAKEWSMAVLPEKK